MDLIRLGLKQSLQSRVGTRGLVRGVEIAARTCRYVATRLKIRKKVIGAEEAERYLRECLTRLDREAVSHFQHRWSRYEWLWYLRRVPDELFEGSVSTTGPYDRALAEALSSQITDAHATPHQSFDQGVFPLSRRSVSAVASLVGYARVTSALQVAYRLCGKGAPLALRRNINGIDIPIPSAVASPDLSREVDVYDARVAESAMSGRMGTPVLGGDEEVTEDSIFLFAKISNGPARLAVPIHDPVREIYATYRPTALRAGRIREVLKRPEVSSRQFWPEELSEVLALLAFGAMVFGLGDEIDQANIMQSGYLLLPETRAEDLWSGWRTRIAALLEDAVGPVLAEPVRTQEQLFESLLGLEATLWPPRSGSLVFTAQEGHLGFDLVAASMRLMTILQFPSTTGAVANARADTFEETTQRMIDDSPWAPPEDIGALARKNLFKLEANEPFAEIDAIGAQGNICLVVSCKSLLYDDRYDRGEYAAVRNARTLIEGAAERWRAVVDELRVEAAGKNFDLSRYDAVHGVVITPQPVFLKDPLLSEETLPGLLRVSTYEELHKWLMQGIP